MKYSLISILFLIGLFGCSENKFKVDSIDDSNYLSVYDNVDELPVVEIPDSNKVYDEIKNKFKQFVMDSSWDKNFSNWLSFFSKNYNMGNARYEFMCRIYLNEEGGIDKVTFIIDPNTKFKNYILNEIKKWKFIPAKKDGKNIKFQFDWVIQSPTLYITSSLSPNSFPLLRITLLRMNEYVMNLPDEMPQPIGGIKAIQSKIHYPEIAKRAGVEGKVYVKTFIDEKGNVVGTEIMKGLGAGLDEAAERAIKETKFKPGMQRGKPVKTRVVVPIVFKLDSFEGKKINRR